jgi:hypothetical protein
MRLSILAALIVIASFALAWIAPEHDAFALERTFAGSAQVDYHLVPTARGANGRSLGFDGFTVEAAAKLTVDFSERFSANLKLCYGCHGFETDMAYFDYRVADALSFRFGRFSPSFGAFNLRHDPANHRLSDKPLPYDMGRMLRLRAWNEGVLPSPFPDNGLEISGAIALTEGATIDYAIHAVSGFKADAKPLDIDFLQSRDGSYYYIDNNGRPSVGGRLSLTIALASTSDLTIGSSAIHGTFDPANDFTYSILGGDISLRLDRTNVRLEYLVRRQEIDTSDPTRLRYTIAPNGDFFVKHGAYAEIEHPITSTVDLIARADGLLRTGNVAAVSVGAPDGDINHRSSIVRGTLGATVSLDRSLRLKASSSLWRFSDVDAEGKDLALSFHLGAVGSF